jgi:sodium transport system permease protein
MPFRRRVHTIYKKELLDILRDRRTLIAMIVVPIVLYPLLMLGSIQAMSHQVTALESEAFVLGVIRESDLEQLRYLIDLDTAQLAKRRQELGEDEEEAAGLPSPLDQAKYLPPYANREALRRAVREREVQVGVVFEHDHIGDEFHDRNPVTIFADEEEVRSAKAASRLEALIERTTDRIIRTRLEGVGLPEEFVAPFDVRFVNLSAPSSILGQILPLILILMTITGAIYPAIDLTAGERERGTLESLMVCPVSVLELIFGKFLVVTTVAIMGATLNLASVSATVYFGGFDQAIAAQEGGVPLGKMAFILLALIPFAVLMSAIMIAVCSYARTFKEAQNYVTPVILAVLIPGGIAALPTTRLEGAMLVMPVGNMVLFARDMLLGVDVSLLKTGAVLLSTTFYAAAAIAVAASVFGKESVVFADAASFRSMFSRRLIQPARRPTVSMSLMVVALLFPTWLFAQQAMSPGPGDDAAGLLNGSAIWMPVFFVLVPLLILSYWRVDPVSSFALRLPKVHHLVAAVLIGLSAWVPAHEVNVLQERVIGAPEAVVQSADMMAAALAEMSPGKVILLIAVTPALCEELLFRGFLLSAFFGAGRKWIAILVSAAIFGTFHFLLFKIPVTVGLGIVLGYLCWQSRSILPGMIAHLLHNTVGALSVIVPQWVTSLGIPEDLGFDHFPAGVIVGGLAVFGVGVLIAGRGPQGDRSPAVASG